MSDHVPAADGRCQCVHEWRKVYEGQHADAAASPVLTARVYAADSARTVPGTSACCEGGE